MPTGESLAIATRLAEVEAMVTRGAWSDIRDTLAAGPATVASSVELSAFYGEALLRLGQPRDTFAWLRPRLDGFAKSANVRAWMRTVNLAGAAAFELGQIDDAEQLFQIALESSNRTGDHLTGGRALNNLALVASMRCDWAAAMRYYTLAMPAYERSASVRGLAECSHNIAATLLESGDLEQAEEWERRAMELAQETGNERLRAFALGGRTEILLRRRDFALSIAIGQQAVAAFRELHDQSSEAHALRLIGQAEHAQGRLDAAMETLTSAIALAESSSVIRIVAECHLARARLYIDLQRDDAARNDLEAALRDFSALGSQAKQLEVARILASLPPRREATGA